jgi:hypothetical protein
VPTGRCIVSIPVHSYGSQHWVSFETGGGRHAYVLTGVVLFNLQGAGQDFKRDTLTFEVPIPALPAGQGLRVIHWAPSVVPASFANDGPPLNTGWAVDAFRLVNTGPVITTATVSCDVAVRDPGSFLYRVSYSLHLVGHIEALA